MATDNVVTIVGNITDDPEMRFTPNGQMMARFNIASNRRWQDRTSGEWREDVSFFTVTSWRDLAENVANSLKKGMRVIVTGRLQQRKWQTQEGESRSVIEIQADEVGPSLRWATASVTKARRERGPGASEAASPRGNDGTAPQSFGGPPAGPPATASQGGGGFPEEAPWEEEPAF